MEKLLAEIDGYTYHFSSPYTRNKFMESYKKEREDRSRAFFAKTGFYLDYNILSDFILYKKIEKKYFFILDKEGKEITWEGKLSFLVTQNIQPKLEE